MSEDTGGRAFLDSNDLGKVFDRVIEDTSSYYILGYSSTNAARDGKYRRITVKTTRPGVTLEYRSGYYAPRDFKHSTHDDREQQLMDALQTDLPPTDLHVFVSPAYFRLADTRFYVPLSVVVPGSDVPFTHATTEDRATLDILGLVLDEARRPVGRIRDTVKLKVEGTTEVRRKTIQYQTSFELPPGSYRVKVAVRENEDGAMGAFESAFTVPDVRKASLKMSAVVVGTQMQAGVKGDNPLVQDGSALVPNATGRRLAGAAPLRRLRGVRAGAGRGAGNDSPAHESGVLPQWRPRLRDADHGSHDGDRAVAEGRRVQVRSAGLDAEAGPLPVPGQRHRRRGWDVCVPAAHALRGEVEEAARFARGGARLRPGRGPRLRLGRGTLARGGAGLRPGEGPAL